MSWLFSEAWNTDQHGNSQRYDDHVREFDFLKKEKPALPFIAVYDSHVAEAHLWEVNSTICDLQPDSQRTGVGETRHWFRDRDKSLLFRFCEWIWRFSKRRKAVFLSLWWQMTLVHGSVRHQRSSTTCLGTKCWSMGQEQLFLFLSLSVARVAHLEEAPTLAHTRVWS